MSEIWFFGALVGRACSKICRRSIYQAFPTQCKRIQGSSKIYFDVTVSNSKANFLKKHNDHYERTKKLILGALVGRKHLIIW